MQRVHAPLNDDLPLRALSVDLPVVSTCLLPSLNIEGPGLRQLASIR